MNIVKYLIGTLIANGLKLTFRCYSVFAVVKLPALFPGVMFCNFYALTQPIFTCSNPQWKHQSRVVKSVKI